MTVVLIASPMPGAGKTAVAAAAAMQLASDGRSVQVSRILPDAAGDPNAADDGRAFAALPFAQDGKRALSPADAVTMAKAAPGDVTVILEAPRGADIAALAQQLDARVILVLRGDPAGWPQAPDLGGRLLGTVAVAVREGALDAARAAMAAAALLPIGVIPEDRGLYAPSIGEVADALGADVAYDSGAMDEVLEHVVIAMIGADAGKRYFQRFPRKAVIVRVDKPDLILSAFAAGTNCLILTGEGSPMLYIVDRARHEEVTILLSHRSTVETMRLLEDIFDSTRFQGGFKLERMVALAGEHADFARALAVTA